MDHPNRRPSRSEKEAAAKPGDSAAIRVEPYNRSKSPIMWPVWLCGPQGQRARVHWALSAIHATEGFPLVLVSLALLEAIWVGSATGKFMMRHE